MSKITKTIAEEIASKLVKKLDDRQKEIDKEFKEIYHDELMKLVPKEILDIWRSENGKWIKTAECGYINYAGRTRYIYLPGRVPRKLDSTLVISDLEVCSRLEMLEKEETDIKKKRKELFNEVSQTLVKLATFNRVREHFPEAAQFLPEIKMELAINIKDTRAKVNQL